MKHRIHCSFIITRFSCIEVLKIGIEANDKKENTRTMEILDFGR